MSRAVVIVVAALFAAAALAILNYLFPFLRWPRADDGPNEWLALSGGDSPADPYPNG